MAVALKKLKQIKTEPHHEFLEWTRFDLKCSSQTWPQSIAHSAVKHVTDTAQPPGKAHKDWSKPEHLLTCTEKGRVLLSALQDRRGGGKENETLWAELEQHFAFSQEDWEGLLKRWSEAPVC